MKRIVKIVLIVLILCLNNCGKNELQVNVAATSYIVIEQSTNKIMEGSNYNESRSVASISKIMTAIVAIENSDVSATYKVPKEGCNIDGSSIYLKENQEITILDLLYGLLLRSGNDAATCLALNTSGSILKFVSLMNEKANKLDLTNTFFRNPTGLDQDDNGNISSALDMAILYSYCMDNPLFAQIVSTKVYKTFSNKNRLLQNYPYCNGGKTGYTKKAKRTLITSASKNNINLIIVTLNCGGDFQSHNDLYEKYFNNYTSIKILNSGINSFDNHPFICSKNYYFVTNKNNLTLKYILHINQGYIEIFLYDEKNNCVDQCSIKIKPNVNLGK